MSSRETTVQRGRRLATALIRRLGEQIRIARVSAGLSQRELGRRIGVSHQTIGRIERADVRSLDVHRLVLVATVLGLNVDVGLYPSGSPVRDAAHLALLDRLRQSLGPAVRLKTELPMPTPGDLRSVDGFILESDLRGMVEAETHVYDVQAVVRRARAKQRDLRSPRLILLLSDSRHHRDLLRRHPELRDDFPVSARTGLRALQEGKDPGGDMIVLL
jgi:transcriptional regulator with XRE-family HTH domain